MNFVEKVLSDHDSILEDKNSRYFDFLVNLLGSSNYQESKSDMRMYKPELGSVRHLKST